MECPSCRVEVPEGGKFCMECGAPLPRACPACGHALPGVAKFCPECGLKLGPDSAAVPLSPAPALPTHAAPVSPAERRQLTVMFCDLVGSTALSARLDPEDLRQVIGTYHKCVAEVVGHFDGFIARYMGDGVLVYFGWPHADEVDAERAVRAALATLEAVGQAEMAGERIAARVGLATGLVVVGDLLGVGAAQEQAVVGETPNLAAHLQALAEPGCAVIDAETRRRIGGLFDCRELGTVNLKGLPDPVPAWQVLGETTVQSRFEAMHPTSLTPLVGRDDELDLLLRRWQQAKEGEGQVVLLSGEPGIGKSRLIAALEERVAGEAPAKLKYFCSPHHRDSALQPIIARWENETGFVRGEPADARLDKLEGLLLPLGVTQKEVTLIAEMLGVPGGVRYPPLNLSPQGKKEQTFKALNRILAIRARQSPILMLFEDAHWADPSSLELLDRAIGQLASVPVLLVISYRSEFQAPWVGQAGVSLIALSRLSPRQAAALASQVVAGQTLPARMLERIVVQTDGVPLFIEELTKTVLESAGQADGITSALPVPSTLHASLMARLDRLSTAKQIAQVGAVIGREFGHELLAAVAGLPEATLVQGLDDLVSAGLAFRRGTPPEATYLFKHALVQDAAYGTLLRGRRQELHARIARVLEAQFQDTVDTQPELLAYHWAQAGLMTKAIAYCLKAGQRAMERSAMAEALAQLTKGLELLSVLPDGIERDRQELDLQVALGKALIAAKGYAAPETGRAYGRAHELCRQLGDSSQLFTVLRGQYVFHNVRAELRTAQQLAEQLLDLAEQDHDPAHLLEAHRTLGHTLTFRGEFVAARTQLQQGLALCDLPARRPDAILYGQHSGIACLSSAAYGRWFLGYPDQALAMSDEAVSWARELSHPFSLAFALYYGTQVRRFRREAYDTGPLMALTNEQGFVYWSTLGMINEGWMLAAQGAMAAGIARIRQGLTAHHATGAALYTSEWLGALAEVHGKAGEPETGLRVLTEALAFMDRTGEAYFAAELHRLQGELLLQRDRAGEPAAEAAYRTAIEIARAQQARSWELRAATSLARLWRGQGRCNRAHDLLAPVYGWFTEGFDTPDLKDAKALLDQLCEQPRDSIRDIPDGL